MIKNIVTVCLGVIFVVSYGLAAPPIPVPGQVIANSVSVDNMQVPSGTTLLGKTLVTTSKNPAFVHLSSGQTIQLHRNSTAYIEKEPAGAIRVSVRSGTLSYRSAAGFATAPPASTVVFAPEVLPVSVPDHQGVKVALVRGAQAGATTIQVNDVTQIDPQMALLLKSPDGQTQEIHYVEAFDGDNVRLTASLRNSFPASSTAGSRPTTGQAKMPPSAFGLTPAGTAAIVLGAVAVVAIVALNKDDETPIPVSGGGCLAWDSNGVCTQPQ